MGLFGSYSRVHDVRSFFHCVKGGDLAFEEELNVSHPILSPTAASQQNPLSE